MPELPEVETMVDRLQVWRGWRVHDLSVDPRMSDKAARKYLPGDEYNDVIGQAIKDVCRRGKFIIFVTSGGALLCHNAMSGYWDSSEEPWTFDYVEGKREAKESDVRVALMLEPPISMERNGDIRTVRFHDARMFGSLRLVDPSRLAEKLSELGPDMLKTRHLYEPLNVVDEEQFIALCEKSKKPIKELLMDQGKVAGVGNIYAAEGLWAAQVLPTRPACELTEEQASRVYHSTRAVLRAALDRKLNYDGLRIYRRAKCSAVGCGSDVVCEDLKGRATYWCPTCQS